MVKDWTRRGGTLLVVCVVLGGCASLPSPAAMQAAVATYQLPHRPAEGEAMVYVVRPSSYFGSVRLNVFLDTQDPTSEMGSTTGEQYIYFKLPSGEHKILSKGENWAETSVAAQAGDILFVQQDAAMPILRGARNTLVPLREDEGKYRVKTLTRGTLTHSTQLPVATVPKQARPELSAVSNTFTGTITGGTWAKGVGFSNLNVKLEVASETGHQEIFYVRSDSHVADADGKDVDYREAARGKGKKVAIEYFTITDDTGGDPSRHDFAFELGEKGVRVLRFLK